MTFQSILLRAHKYLHILVRNMRLSSDTCDWQFNHLFTGGRYDNTKIDQWNIPGHYGNTGDINQPSALLRSMHLFQITLIFHEPIRWSISLSDCDRQQITAEISIMFWQRTSLYSGYTVAHVWMRYVQFKFGLRLVKAVYWVGFSWCMFSSKLLMNA